MILGAKPDIPTSEIPAFFESFAAAYIKSKSIDQAAYLSDQAREARKRAQENIDEGNFAGAERVLQESVQGLEGNLERNQKDLVRMYADLGDVLTMKAEYKASSEAYSKAAALVEKGATADFAAPTLRMMAWRALLSHSTSYVDKSTLRQVIGRAKTVAADLDAEGETVAGNWVRSWNVSAMQKLAEFESDDSILEEAEASFDGIVKGCDERKPRLDCYFAFSVFAQLFSERGSRTLLTKEGRARQESRLLRAVQAARLAKLHADRVTSESTRMEAGLEYAFTEMLYAAYVGDTERKESSGKRILDKFNGLYPQISNGDYPDVLDMACRTLIVLDSVADESTATRIADVEARRIEKWAGKKNYAWAERQYRLGRILEVAWRKTNDSARLLQAIQTSERAFEFFDDKVPAALAMRQIDFAILLSDYGRQVQSVTYLERAVLTFKKMAADNFYKLQRLYDRGVALRNMLVSLGRLQNINGKACWRELQQQVEAEALVVQEAVNVSVRVMEAPSSASEEARSGRSEVLKLSDRLGQMKSALDRMSDSCLPAHQVSSTLRKIA